MHAQTKSVEPANIHAFMSIPLAELVESKTNPRTVYDDLDELAASIKAQGVIEPIIARVFASHPTSGTTYEIVAGARRFRASKLAKATHIPAVVRSLSDEQVLEIQIIENLQRRDIHSLDEAVGFQRLVEIAKLKPEQIAAKVGKSVEYIYGRMKLAELIDKAKAALRAGKVSTEHGALLARLPEKDQLLGLARCTLSHHPMTVRDLRHWVQERDDRNKTQLRVQGEISKAKAAGEKVVTISYDTYGDIPAQALKPGQYALAGKAKCEHLARGFVVESRWNGTRRESGYEGTSVKVCTSPDKCTAHKPSAAPSRAKPRQKSAAEKAADTKAKVKQKAEAIVLAQVLGKVKALGVADYRLIAGAFVEAMWQDKRKELAQRRGWEFSGFELAKQITRKVAAMSGAELAGLLVDLAITQSPELLKPFAKRARVDIAKIERQVLAGLKKPQTSTKTKSTRKPS